MLTGDRRWAPTRKLTVLGKVPKPINLPSQRLENHGLDPNVEIVPKGTLTWGSRPSTAAPNAWGTSSSSSPLADGNAGSLSPRPSSGGGTRPSTAGCDRSSEPVSNVWGPSSRPSSASGVLTSSQISAAATRPRSADTRPGSSQLSRFADSSTDCSVAWGTSGTAEKLGTTSSKGSGFTLSSGDFPSLSSDKNSDAHLQRGHSSQGRPQSSQGRPGSSQGRPSSASGADSRPNEFLEHHGSRNTDHFEHRTVNTWKADNPQHGGHGASPNIDNWHRDHHQGPYPNMNMPRPHYDSWHNPPFHPADGAWYRGGAPGGPYRPPGPPSNYPIDYPHVPARPLSNSQQFPRQDAGPGGFFPSTCEPYRPYMPSERYMGPGHPDVPIRPGAYQGPVPYEGCYGPPHPNFYNSSERDTSIMGMSHPVVPNQYATQHLSYDHAKFHARPGGYGSVMNKEHMEPHQANEIQGPYKVLLKQHVGSEDCNETVKMEDSVASGTSHFEKEKHSGGSVQKGDWGTKSQTQEMMVSPCSRGVPSRPASGVDAQLTGNMVKNSSMDAPELVDDGLTRRTEAANIQNRGLHQYPVIKKNASLMEKVESLNNKARIADSHGEGGSNSSRDKPTYFKDVTAGADQFSTVASFGESSVDNIASTLNTGTVMPKELNTLAEDKGQETTTDRNILSFPLNSADAGDNTRFLGQKKAHVTKNVDYHSKTRASRHDNDEWSKKNPGSESLMNTTVASSKGGAVETDVFRGASEKLALHPAANFVDGSQTVDLVDQKAQRAKMREITMQRAKRLQEEEEERTREQKAKALAKLEELNRRTLAESSDPKSSLQSSDVLNNKTESGPNATPAADTASIEASGATSVCNSEEMKKFGDCGIVNAENSAVLYSAGAVQASHSTTQSSSIQQESSITAELIPEMTLDRQHTTIGMQKQVGYRKKNSNLQDASTVGKQKKSSSPRNPTDSKVIVVNDRSSDPLPNVEDPPVQHKKRNSRSSRNNNANKLAEGLTSSTSPSPPHTAASSENPCTDSGKVEPSTLVEKAVLVPTESSNENVGTMNSMEAQDIHVEHNLHESTESSHGRGSNLPKPHPQRKTSRNQQPNKPVSKYHANEAVMWAPVKSLPKNEAADEVGRNSITEPAKSIGKSGKDMQVGLKAKRAEIERYVPKPVAKELSQQASSQQAASPSLSEPALGDTTGLPSTDSGRLDGPAVGKASAASDTRNGENPKRNKNGKSNASWRQRGLTESPPVQGSRSSDQPRAVQKASDPLQTSDIVGLQDGRLTHTDDGWNDISENVSSGDAVSSTVVGKSYGASRQRRQPYKSHTVAGSNQPAYENTGSQQGITDRSERPSPAWAHNEEGRNSGRNESHNAGFESTKPQWQPKSQAYSHGRQGNHGNRGAPKTGPLTPGNVPAMNEDTNTHGKRTTEAEAGNTWHQASSGQRKTTADPAKDQTTGKLAPSTGSQHDRPLPLGGNQRGQHYDRFHREHDPNHRGRDFGQEIYKQGYGDRRRINQHVEYQRIGSYDENPDADEATHEPSRGPGAKYRDRGGRHFPARGGGQFYGRRGGASARVGDTYNGGE